MFVDCRGRTGNMCKYVLYEAHVCCYIMEAAEDDFCRAREGRENHGHLRLNLRMSA